MAAAAAAAAAGARAAAALVGRAGAWRAVQGPVHAGQGVGHTMRRAEPAVAALWRHAAGRPVTTHLAGARAALATVARPAVAVRGSGGSGGSSGWCLPSPTPSSTAEQRPAVAVPSAHLQLRRWQSTADKQQQQQRAAPPAGDGHESDTDDEEVKKLTLSERGKRLMKKYGWVAAGVYTTIYVTAFSSIALAIHEGVDMVKVFHAVHLDRIIDLHSIDPSIGASHAPAGPGRTCKAAGAAPA